MRWLNLLLCLAAACPGVVLGSSVIFTPDPTALPDGRPFVNAYEDGFAFVTWRDWGEDELIRKLARIRATGASHLSVPYFACQNDIHSSQLGTCPPLSPIDPVRVARLALMQGFSVSFLPIVSAQDGSWRGYFDPTDVPAWFASYAAWLRQIIRDSKSLGLRELIVSTEMSGLYRYEYEWRKLLWKARAEFDGPVIVTANWDNFELGFWSDVDAIGISAYFPLVGHPNPTQEELDSAWTARHKQLMDFSRRWNRPIHMTEVGYPSLPSAAARPWDYSTGNRSDPALQARCFEAFRKAWEGERGLVRVDIWSTEAQDPRSPSFRFNHEPVGKAAEGVLARFFMARRADD